MRLIQALLLLGLLTMIAIMAMIYKDNRRCRVAMHLRRRGRTRGGPRGTGGKHGISERCCTDVETDRAFRSASVFARRSLREAPNRLGWCRPHRTTGAPLQSTGGNFAKSEELISLRRIDGHGATPPFFLDLTGEFL